MVNYSTNKVGSIDEGVIQDNIENNINQMINGFSGGFIGTTNQESHHVNYFIQSKSTSVGFSQSSLQFISNSDPSSVVDLKFLDSNPVFPKGLNALNSKYTYFNGLNKSNWIEKSFYQSIIYENIYDNIDLYYELKDGSLKYEFYVYPSGDVSDIKLAWEGSVRVESSMEGMSIQIGDLTNNPVNFVDSNPINYDSELRDKEIKGYFREIGTNIYGFDVPQYDADKLLIIDPSLIEFSTYVSGSDEDFTESMVLDSSDNIYVTGYTKSVNFPTSIGAFDITADDLSYTFDAFVFKLSPDGTTLIYATYISGSGNEYGRSIVVDDLGNAYVTGLTGSADFPVTFGAMNETKNSANDAFILKLSSDGSSLLFSTYFGGSDDDDGLGIAIDSLNNIYITGNTRSTDLPTTASAYDNVGDGTSSFSDTFITKISSDGSSLINSTYIGGSSYDTGKSIKVDSDGNAYITGITYSSDYPTTAGSHDQTLSGATDVFATKLAANGSTLIYSTFLSLSYQTDDAYDLVLDAEGNAYITGNYYVSSLMAIMVIKLAANGSKILHSKSMPAGGHSYGYAINLDDSGYIYVGGTTYGDSFQVTSDAINSTGHIGSGDSVLFKLSPDMSVLNYSTYLGGSGVDDIRSIGINSEGSIVIAGRTSSNDFPVTSGVFNETSDNSTKYDVFVASIKILNDTSTPNIIGSSTLSYEYGSTGNTISWDVSDDFPGTYNITLDGILLGDPINYWTTGVLSINVDNLAIGIYVYNLSLYDGSGNMAFHVVTLTVSDTTAPDIIRSTTYSYEYGSTGNSIIWNISDDNPGTYNITLNGILIGDASYSWTSGTILINVDNLAIGIYVYTLYLYDGSGNMAVHVVTLMVSDTSAPDIIGSTTYSYEYGNTGNNITWNVSDDLPGTYNITLDGILLGDASNSWTSGTISINVDYLAIGIYVYNLTLYDESGNAAFHVVTLTVSDGTAPNIIGSTTYSYEYGNTGNNITWNVSDDNSGTYNITLDGILFGDAINSWTSGTISINADNLEIGIYEFKLTLYDGSGNVVSHIVTLSVSDTTTPLVNSPDDVTYNLGSENNTIVWVIGDLDPSEYNITIDGVIHVPTTTWVNGSIIVNIDNLETGTHTITIFLYDVSGNLATDSVIVTVLDETSSTSSTDRNDTTSDAISETETTDSIEDGDQGFLNFSIQLFRFGLTFIVVIRNKKKM